MAAVQYQFEEEKKQTASRAKFFTPVLKRPHPKTSLTASKPSTRTTATTSGKAKSTATTTTTASSSSATAAVAKTSGRSKLRSTRNIEKEAVKKVDAEEDDVEDNGSVQDRQKQGRQDRENENVPAPEDQVDHEDEGVPHDLHNVDTHLPDDSGVQSKSIKKTSTTKKKQVPSDDAPPKSQDPVPESWEKNYMEFPDHLKYFQKIRMAQKKANETSKRIQVCWRGYRTSIPPKSGKLRKYELLQRLIQAVKNIRNHKPNEKNVS